MSKTSSEYGKVYLVGAGPGDPGLITLRGVECLSRAELLLYDYLVNPAILQHVAAGAEVICLGRHGRDRIWPQSEINATIVEAACAGKTVVRLKGGDPAVFARGAEEIEALASAGIQWGGRPGGDRWAGRRQLCRNFGHTSRSGIGGRFCDRSGNTG